MVTGLIPHRSRVPTLFDELGREFGTMLGWFDREEMGGEMDFVPTMSVAETEKTYEVNVDLPGVNSEDIGVEVRDSSLWISGERHDEKKEKGKKYHRIEHRYGSFQRSIPLGEAVDAEHIVAQYKNGVLKISIPKTESAAPKKIPIKS
ncbi:MAG: Hsp20/alpha crystallin family protein [Pirellulales bacterium]|nr:Hsp20/alpha crystallin family protein [Pirellulales bacterium]